jgi:hypothetical protein
VSVVQLLLVAAPLRLTLWVVGTATAVIVVVIAVGIARDVERVRAERRANPRAAGGRRRSPDALTGATPRLRTP